MEKENIPKDSHLDKLSELFKRSGIDPDSIQQINRVNVYQGYMKNSDNEFETVDLVSAQYVPKPETTEEADECLQLLSGRQHRVFTAISVITPKDQERKRLVEARLRFKRLSAMEVEAYLAAGEWRGKAGGYAIQGLAGVFLVKLIGSYTAVVGLPLYETMSLLAGEGYPVLTPWFARA